MSGRRGAVIATLLLITLVGAMGAATGAPSPGYEGDFVTRIANERSAAGLAGYSVSSDLVDVARNHAEEMARQQRLHHNSNLGNQVKDWNALGENVGKGANVEDIHRAFMESSSHRAEILSNRFTQVGVGVVERDGVLWVVQVFRQPSASTSAKSSEPSGSPPPPPPSDGGSDAGRPTAAPAPAPSSTSTAPSTTSPAATLRQKARAAAPVAPAPAVVTTVATTAPPPVVAAPAVEDVESTAVIEEFVALDLSGALPPQSLQVPQALRDVSAPVGVAATLLVLVVAGLAVRVALDERAVRPVAGAFA